LPAKPSAQADALTVVDMEGRPAFLLRRLHIHDRMSLRNADTLPLLHAMGETSSAHAANS